MYGHTVETLNVFEQFRCHYGTHKRPLLLFFLPYGTQNFITIIYIVEIFVHLFYFPPVGLGGDDMSPHKRWEERWVRDEIFLLLWYSLGSMRTSLLYCTAM